MPEWKRDMDEQGFSRGHFDFFRRLLCSKTGMVIPSSKYGMVYSRLSPRLRHLGLGHFDQYRRHLLWHTDEISCFINALMTNHAGFFRESRHFEALKSMLLRTLLEQAASHRKLRLWCTAVSTGEEPYSLAMTMKEAIPDPASWDVKLLATDIDSDALAGARRGIYNTSQVSGLSRCRLERHFDRRSTGGREVYRVRDDLRHLVLFRRLNLMSPWPHQRLLDVIFCRNVAIYFDRTTQQQLFDRLGSLLRPGGYLIVGQSESLAGLTERFITVEHSIYQKP